MTDPQELKALGKSFENEFPVRAGLIIQAANDYAALLTAAREVVKAEQYALYASYKDRHTTIDNAVAELAALLPAEMIEMKPKNIKAGDDFGYMLNQQINK